MENGFLCILKNAAPEDMSVMGGLRDRFAEMRTYDKENARIVWFGDALPFPYFMGSSILVDGNREYPTSEIFLDPMAMTLTVRTDALGFQSPCVGEFEGILFVSNSVTTITAAARHFSIPLRFDPEAIRTEISYKITPIGKTVVSGISEEEGGTDAVYGFPGNEPGLLRKDRVRRIDFSKTDSAEEDCHAAYLREFEESIERIVQSTEGEKIGILFSGGFDSSVTLNALLRHGKHRRGGIAPLTVVGAYKPLPDEEFSKMVSKELDVERHVIPLLPEDFDLLPDCLQDIGDPTDAGWFGILLKKAFREAREMGIRTVVSGSGTDAPIGATRGVMSAFWYLCFWPNAQEKSLIDKKSFSDTGGELSKRLSEIPKNPERFLAKMEDLTFQLNSGIVDVPKGHYLPDWLLDSYDPQSPPCLHDLLTLFDLVGFSHRSATLYSKIAWSEGIRHVSPFGSKVLREMLYSFPTRYKFDPSRYVTTEWDNQFFYKNALRSLAPTASFGRKKIVGSLADHRMWILSERNVENIRSILSDFEKRNVLPADSIRKLAEEYADPFKRTFFFGYDSKTHHSHLLWKIIATEQTLRILIS